MTIRDQARASAEATFKKKERQLRDGQKAVAEQETARRAVNAKTVRLRALPATGPRRSGSRGSRTAQARRFGHDAFGVNAAR